VMAGKGASRGATSFNTGEEVIKGMEEAIAQWGTPWIRQD